MRARERSKNTRVPIISHKKPSTDLRQEPLPGLPPQKGEGRLGVGLIPPYSRVARPAFAVRTLNLGLLHLLHSLATRDGLRLSPEGGPNSRLAFYNWELEGSFPLVPNHYILFPVARCPPSMFVCRMYLLLSP